MLIYVNFILWLCRYAGQACIIGQSNLSRKQVDCLLEESTEDAIVSDTLKNTDVVLSLNKKQRWSLPATLTHLIRAGRFANSEAMVSVLERHKLKKKANCVGFTCSKQTGLSGQDVQGGILIEGVQGYFSFNINSFDNAESRRKRKKRMAKWKIQLARQKKRKEKKDKRNDMQTVDVMTVAGGRIDSQSGKKPSLNNRPGYTLEVFYPCPQSCSLTFNPKYTDVIMTQNDDGEMEISSNVKSGKKSHRKHRRKCSDVDLSAICTEARYCDDDVEEMWREECEDKFNDYEKIDTFVAANFNDLDSLTEENKDTSNSKEQDRHRLNKNILAGLLDQAERARAQWSSVNFMNRHRRRSGRDGDNLTKKMDSMTLHHRQNNTCDDKPHVFEIERPITLQKPRPARKENSAGASKYSQSKKDPVLSSAPVILSFLEVSPESLRGRFGQLYSEAKCQPRRFCINITDDVVNLLSVYRSVKVSAAFSTFIVFTSKGVYDKGMETYEANFNCAACLDSEKITHTLPHGPTTLDSVINTFAGNLLDLKHSGHLNISQDYVSNSDACADFDPLGELLMEKMNVEVETFFAFERLNWADQVEKIKEINDTDDAKGDFAQGLMALAEYSEKDIFCDICYENVNPTQIDAAPGTQLNECGHLFCDSCWRTHLRTRLREGTFRMTCPGYQCDVKLEPSTLLSILHVTEVIQILRREFEEEIDSCTTAKWCPRPNCGRVIRLRTKSSGPQNEPNEVFNEGKLNFDVTCYCGDKMCFNCLSPAHWPARCEQAQDYLDKVATLKPINESTEEEPNTAPVAKPKRPPPMPLEVEGRLCPRCSKFIQKNGGCSHMVCKCGHSFCWICMAPVSGHPTKCIYDAATLYKYSRRLKVHHVIAQPNSEVEEEEAKKKVTPPSRRQKASMYQRALRQRSNEEKNTSWLKPAEDLAYKICKVAGKDLQFKREVRKLKQYHYQ